MHLRVRELHRLNRAGSMLKITSRWQDPEILFYFIVLRVGILQKIARMLKPLVLKFRPDLCVRLKYMAEKEVPAKLKPIVPYYQSRQALGPYKATGITGYVYAREPLRISKTVAAEGVLGQRGQQNFGRP